jgi:gas vesicle protein
MQEETPGVCAVVNTLPIRLPRKVLAQGYQYMNTHTQEHRDYGFMIGLLTGTCVGAGLAMWLVPRAGSELRQRVTDSARSLGVGEAVDELTRKGQGVRDDVAEAVARGAHEVERYATAAKSDRGNGARKHAAADRSPSKPRSL